LIGSRLDQPQGWFFRVKIHPMSRTSPERDLHNMRVSQIAELPFHIPENGANKHRIKVLGPSFLMGLAAGALAYFASGSPVLAFAAGSVTIPATVFLVEHFHLE